MAAKRYYQSKKDRRDEREGEERYLRGRVKNLPESRYKENHGGPMDPEHYSEPRRGSERGNMISGYHRDYPVGTDPRKTEAMQDGGMIREDMRAIANLPQEVMMKPYPMTGPYLPEGLDDTIAGVDRQMDYDDQKRRMNFYPKKV